MKNFNIYAQYYDLLYRDKDYEAEVKYVDKLISQFMVAAGRDILDLGCGTGKHDYYLSELGYRIDGVDLSDEMISLATNNFKGNSNLRFFQGNIKEWKSPENKKYDVVISLFHVISYQKETNEVLNAFRSAFNHLKKGGLFIYDFWYGPGVLTDKPVVRIKRLENEKIKVQRISEPVQHFNENVVDVNFDVQILDKTSGNVQNFNEVHKMRYFFLPELTFYAMETGFSRPDYLEWLGYSPLNSPSWYGVAIQRKP